MKIPEHRAARPARRSAASIVLHPEPVKPAAKAPLEAEPKPEPAKPATKGSARQ